MLPADHIPLSDIQFRPPSAPFAQTDSLISSNSAGSSRPDSADLSLTINYVPSKFSGALLSHPRRRKSNNVTAAMPVMGIPRGGGTDAFRHGEARMPDQNDDDYDGVNISKSCFGGRKRRGKARMERKLRWNTFKTIIFLSNAVFFIYALTTLIFCLLTWLDFFHRADVIRTGNRPELIFSTVAAVFGLFTAIIGFAGILLNNRGFLAFYTFFLWITFVFLVIPGYITYKKREFNLEGKLNAQWSRALGTSGRLRIQNKLGCCGWFSPFVEATISQTCYARSVLPGCKLAYMNWQRHVLKRWYTIAFALVPLQIAAIVAGLLCSNHVTYRYGKGMMPERYRLNPSAMKVIAENYANQIAEQYGTEVVSDITVNSGIQTFGSNLTDSSYPLTSSTPRPFDSTGCGRSHGKTGGPEAGPPIPYTDSLGGMGSQL